MRKYLLLVLALSVGLVVAPLHSQQSADEMVGKYLQRIGGDRFRAVRSLRRTGNLFRSGRFRQAPRS